MVTPAARFRARCRATASGRVPAETTTMPAPKIWNVAAAPSRCTTNPAATAGSEIAP
ncbi:hypothetical protein [Microbispora sp. GKU 823]|uniref:hypothetical protein n=1 Tax=Microbispora sp. GKU 823 TaxID=1652100 RepID=UPI0015C4C46F|nr:hypothetical protein [Microbispora sp. GKU 823]